MDGFEKRRQQKKDAILSASLALFKLYGFKKVSIAEIANKASVSQVSIYNFFNSKENLKQESKKKLLDDHVHKAMLILDNNAPVIEKLEALLRTRIDSFGNFSSNFLEFLQDDTMENNLFFKEYMSGEEYHKVINSIYNLLEQGKKEGIFESSISTEAMLSYLEIFQSYLINNPLFITKLDNNSKFSRDIFSLFMNAFKKK